MRLLVAGGGTGGHLFPGLALAEEVKTRHPRNDVLFVGSARGIEARVVPKSGYPLQLIDVGPLKGQGLRGFLRGMFRLPRAFIESLAILRKFDPDVVVGVGGYASGPAVMAAFLLRIPTAVQEQNALPGFTNRMLGKLVRAVFIAFEEARPFFPPASTHLLGNPIRRAFLDNYLHLKPPGARLSIFVTGGSQGARGLNSRVADAVEMLAPTLGPRLRILHQTGAKDADAVGARYAKLEATGIEASATPFIEDMARAYADADLLVCRAGATTIAELTVCKKPSILVPFPFAADDHQTVNARSLVEAGAAVLLQEAQLTGEKLAAELRHLEADRPRLQRMSRAAGLLGRPEAAREIADVCVSLCSKRLVKEGRNLPDRSGPAAGAP
ncbi:MAG TPA: undecaprenyldiphospho-muramoylpentapeptide beta-N-acetylglucosaminyltransferase [Myxococcales bacterium]|jgi:UDP-N-acetylglucosamine--N-acetylmuramyl-(pentapeptide) pyrophosphoryl-undecaprenol N-acetylglucosamine transferase|nr:undecaprenyldiphospho-muramoylpentapeptide beta-N-acetylglucosaminyltransferase [Myxococcales bacterium]